jgi:SAM-dependent methyltransferase
MFDTYQDVFDERGTAYHQAMQRYPSARKQEFELILEMADPRPGQVICDMPSGGGYLHRFLPTSDLRVIAVENSQAFFEQCEENAVVEPRLCDLPCTDLSPASVDTVVSMAGLHHQNDKRAFFREAHRLLKPGGQLCVADVQSGSAIDGFLNTFVDEHNSMGHQGAFIEDEVRSDLRTSGFRIEHDRVTPYTWDFDSVEDMVAFCTLLFGLDQATPQEVLDGIRRYPGYEEREGRCRMNWELVFLGCEKQKCEGSRQNGSPKSGSPSRRKPLLEKQ